MDFLKVHMIKKSCKLFLIVLSLTLKTANFNMNRVEEVIEAENIVVVERRIARIRIHGIEHILKGIGRQVHKRAELCISPGRPSTWDLHASAFQDLGASGIRPWRSASKTFLRD